MKKRIYTDNEKALMENDEHFFRSMGVFLFTILLLPFAISLLKGFYPIILFIPLAYWYCTSPEDKKENLIS